MIILCQCYVKKPAVIQLNTKTDHGLFVCYDYVMAVCEHNIKIQKTFETGVLVISALLSELTKPVTMVTHSRSNPAYSLYVCIHTAIQVDSAALQGFWCFFYIHMYAGHI